MTHSLTAQIAAHELNWPRRAIYTAHILPCEALICYVAMCSCITFALLASLLLNRHRCSLWPPSASFARRAVDVPRPVVTQQMRLCGSGLVVLLRNKIPDLLRRGSLEAQVVVLLPRSALRLVDKGGCARAGAGRSKTTSPPAKEVSYRAPAAKGLSRWARPPALHMI